MGVAHFPFQLGTGDQGGDGIDHDDIQGPASNECLGDLQGLLSRIRLRHQELGAVHPQPLRIREIERVFGIDESCGPSGLLGLGDHVQSQRCFPRRFRPIDFNNTAPWQPADPEGEIETERSCGDRRHIGRNLRRPELHD